MASYNKVFLMGNFTRDPQLKMLSSQTPVVDFGLAVNRKFKKADGTDGEEVAFVDCTMFGRGAEVINQYCTKGKPIFVEGRIKFDTWDDKQGGGKRSKLSVVVENFQFLGAKGGDGDGEPPAAPAKPAARRAPARGKAAAPAEPPFSGEQQFKDDDIPF